VNLVLNIMLGRLGYRGSRRHGYRCTFQRRPVTSWPAPTASTVEIAGR
jgi:hypothetical protein